MGAAVPHSSLDAPVPLALVTERAAGHRGRPGLTGSRAGADWSPAFTVDSVERPGEGSLVLRCSDAEARLALGTELHLDGSGVLRMRHALRNDGIEPYAIGELACVLPVPSQAREVLDLAGRWCRERVPQRREFVHGAWVRGARRARTGHDATLVLAAGTSGFGFRSGEVWAVHLGWSGDSTAYAERGSDGRDVLGAAEPPRSPSRRGSRPGSPFPDGCWAPSGCPCRSCTRSRPCSCP